MIHLNPTGAVGVASSSDLLRPDTIVRAQVLKRLEDGTLILRIKQNFYRVRSEVELPERAWLRLKVVTGDVDGWRLRLLSDKKANSAMFLKELDLLRLDHKLLLALMQYDEKFRKTIAGDLLQRDVKGYLFDAAKRLRTIVEKSAGVQELQELMMDMEALGNGRILEWWQELQNRKLIEKLERLRDGALTPMKRELDDLAALLQLFGVIAQASNAMVGFLPLIWEELEHNAIAIKKIPRQEAYLCTIVLGFKDIRHVGVTLILHRRHLSIHLHVEDEEFRSLLRRSAAELRLGLEAYGKYVSVSVSDFRKELFGELILQDNIVDKQA